MAERRPPRSRPGADDVAWALPFSSTIGGFSRAHPHRKKLGMAVQAASACARAESDVRGCGQGAVLAAVRFLRARLCGLPSSYRGRDRTPVDGAISLRRLFAWRLASPGCAA